jgi:hypothetical protein
VAIFCCACQAKPIDLGPAYGTSVKLSTLPGFLEGKWKEGIDASQARSKQLAQIYNSVGFQPVLIFKSDKSFTYKSGKSTAEGAWNCDDRGVNLYVIAVDDVPVHQVQADYAKYKKYNHGFGNTDPQGRMHRAWDSRGRTLEMVNRCSRLEVFGDTKRLYVPSPSIERDGSTPVGITVFRRLQT